MSKKILTTYDFDSVNKVTGLAAGSADSDAATMAQLRAGIEGLAWKDSARVASTGNLTLTGPGASIDAVTLSNGDRVLVKNQTTQTENGIYIFNGSGSTMTRALDGSTFDELESAVLTIDEGTANAGTTWRQTQVNGVIGTNNVVFSSFGASVPSASDTTQGIIELATQGEVNAGTDAVRAVTPATLTGWTNNKLKFALDVGDGSATAYNVDHNFGTKDLLVSVHRTGTPYDEVDCDITFPTTNRVTVTFGAAPASNAYRVVVLG